MSKDTKKVEVPEVEVAEEVVEAPKARTEVESTGGAYTKAEFAKLIENYKKQNPAKYELKKEALEAKLKTLK